MTFKEVIKSIMKRYNRYFKDLIRIKSESLLKENRNPILISY